MITRISLLVALLVPLSALALTIEPADFYSDVHDRSSEAPGINLLTREDVVQGYGNRLFGPTRLVNRAEFLKIAILASPDGFNPDAALEACFPDVLRTDWFAPYVCSAKALGIIRGNVRANVPAQEWTFDPADTVTYDAALKMLTLLFHYDIPDVTGADWAEPYYQAAAERGVDLPIRITFDTPMTRGMAARLAGAFVAERSGLLAEYRLAEGGSYAPPSPSSASSQSSETSSQSSSAVSSSSSSAQPTSLFTLPSVSHFLLVGSTTDAIADGVIRSSGEPAKVSLAQVKLFSEVRSIDYLELVTSNGVRIAKLRRRTTTDLPDYKQTFEAQIQPEEQVSIPADTDVSVILRAVIRSVDNAGFSDELLQVRTISVTIKGESSLESINLPVAGPFFKHQTSFGRITRVLRTSPETGTLTSGQNITIGSYSFDVEKITGKNLKLRTLIFSLAKTGSATVGNWRLVNPVTGTSVSCSLNQETSTVTCTGLDQSVGLFATSGPLTLDLTASVTIPAGTHDTILQTSLSFAGSPESLGSIEWTDESGIFRWIESPSPIVVGTKLQS